MVEQGYAYSLGTGATDVYTEEQASSGGTMMLFGFITAVTAPLMIASGGLRTFGAASAIGEAGALSRLTPAQALTRGLDVLADSRTLAPGVLQQGRLILTYEADGVVIGTIEGNPNVLMIARDGEAVMYVRTAEGLEEAARAPLIPAGAGGEGGVGIPYESQWPTVTQKTPNWCGAACGEMAAGRLGTTVTQEELAASRFFEEAFEVEGQVVRTGGFQTKELGQALEELAPVAGRKWVGGTILGKDVSTAASLQKTLEGFLQSTDSSIILRVKGTEHWIIVDEITSEGRS